MHSIDLRTRAQLASRQLKRAGVTQSELAKHLRVSQSQVSRALSGSAVRPSRVFNAVCEYAERQMRASAGRFGLPNDELIQALQEVWDGTSEHATALASVIRSLGLLQKPTRLHAPPSKRAAKHASPKGRS